MYSSKGKAKPKPVKPINVDNRWRPKRLALLVACFVALALAVVAVELLRPSPEQLSRRAKSLLADDPGQAAILLERSIEQRGGAYPQAQLLLCRALGQQGRWLEALGVLSAIDAQTCEQQELLALANFASRAEQPIFQEYALRAALLRGPDQVRPLRLLIPLRYRLGRTDQLLEDCEQLARLAPEDPMPWEFKAVVHKQRGDFLAAIEDYQNALERSPTDSVKIREDLVQLLLYVGDTDTARRELDQLMSQTSAPITVRLKHAELLRLEGKLHDAIEAAEQALREDPRSLEALQLRGILHLDANQYRPAIAALRQVVGADPHHQEAHFKLSQAYSRDKQPRLAQKHLLASQRLVRLRLESIRLIAQAEREPSNVQVREQLARTYDELGRSEIALQWREAAEHARKGL